MKTKKVKPISEVFNELRLLPSLNIQKFYSKLKPALKQEVDAQQLNEATELIAALKDARFKLYLKLVPGFTMRQMNSKNKQMLLNRLYKHIKDDVWVALLGLNAALNDLDLLSENEARVEEWLKKDSKNAFDPLFLERATLSYIYIALKMDSKQLLAFETLLLKLLERDAKPRFDRRLFPDALTSKSLQGMLNIKTAYTALKAESFVSANENNLNKTIVENQKLKLEEKELELTRLLEKITELEERLDFEVRKYQKSNREAKEAYIDGLNRRLFLELTGIHTILEHVEQTQRELLLFRVSNIEEILSSKER